MEGIGEHGDSDFLKISYFQDGCQGSHLENFQTRSPSKQYVGSNKNLAGGTLVHLNTYEKFQKGISWQSESKKDAYFWFCWHF